VSGAGAGARGALVTAAVACGAAALASLPFESERLGLPLGPIVMTLPEGLIGAAVVATAAAAWSSRARLPLLPDRAFAAAVTAVVAVLLLSTAAAPEHRVNAVKFTLRLAGGAAFGLAAAWLARVRAVHAGWLLAAYAAGVAAAGGIGLAEMLVGAPLDPVLAAFRDHAVYIAGARRLTGTFGYSNIAAASIALALPMVVTGAAQWSGWPARIAGLGVAAVMAPALVLTYSRGGLTAGVVGLLAVGWWAGRLGVRRGRRLAAAALAAVLLCWVGLASGNALLSRRAMGQSEATLLDARVQAAPRRLEAVAGSAGEMPVTVTNAGSLAWRSTDETPYRITSGWYDARGQRVDPQLERTELPPRLAPGESVTLSGRYRVPEHVGLVWLAWDVVIEHRLLLSQQGSQPAWVPVVVGKDAADARRLAAAIETAGVGSPPSLTGWTPPPRGDLWRAAWRMLRERPWLGHGPDSYRWEYGRYLGLGWWDRRVYANNVALELLATTGVLGLAAFTAVGVVLWRRARAALERPRGGAVWRGSVAAAVAALVVFGVHGLVDYFLEFTAGYAPLWAAAGIVVGLAASPDGE
jgi:hypothetical protein